MTFVVTDNCVKCKYTDCVEVCPVDCFYEGPNFLVIHPDECIDCALCEPECPAEAIFSEDEVPAGQEQYIELNAELSEEADNNITEQKDPLPDAEEWTAYQTKSSIWNADIPVLTIKSPGNSCCRGFLFSALYIRCQLSH